MSVFTGIVLYMIIYWTALFAVLPWGNRTPDNPEEGMATSAPANPHIARKFAITAVVAAVIWVIIYVLVDHHIIDFRSIARHMREEDMLE